MTTDKSLTGSERVRKFQTMLHAKAKEDPKRRLDALCDKVWREDFLKEAWEQVRRNGGTAGVDGEGFKDIEAYGVEGWLGELARDLREGTYEPKAVRQVLIPKKQPGKYRPLGIPCIRDRVAQSSALLVLEPIFEADLQREQYGYRPGRSANDAVRRVRGLLERGHSEVVDGDLSNYFGEIPQPEDDGVGELLQPGAGEPGLPSDRPPRGPAAASVALSEAQGEDRGDGALLGRETMENLWTHLPGVEATEPSVGEGMILTESRMRENRTSGLTSGGEETQRGTRLRHR